MKFFWKIFLSIFSIVTIMYLIFGGALLYASFNNSLDREVQSETSENKMFMNMLKTSIGVSVEEDDNISEGVVNAVKSVKNSLGQNRYDINLYDSKGKMLYNDSSTKRSIVLSELGKKSSAYMIKKEEDAHYLETVSRIRVYGKDFYVSSIRNIQYIYEERDIMYSQYQFMLIVSLILSAYLSYLLSKRITKPVVELTKITKQMAEGDYSVRAEKPAGGEVGILIGNFNVMADKLEENIIELEDSVRREETFTANFAHELKTPLTAIVGYSDMLRSMDLKGKEVKEYSNYIFSQGKRLEKLSFTLMELISVDKQNINFEKINMKKLLKAVGELAKFSMKKKSIQFKVQAGEGYVLGNEELLISMINNLVDNARKAVEKEGTIVLSGGISEGNYVISVQDNGCGMEQEELRKITEAFYMVDKSRARKEGGAGIGMALCKKIVSLHDAKWKIGSKPGVGTTVYVMIPCYKAK